jgi:molybdopterin-guanine dinucleotide biosynthesis protein A
MRRETGVVAIILAGGRASRMGGEKPFAMLKGEPLIAHAIERARPHVDEVLISANERERYRQFGCEVVQDRVSGFQGPLAGVLAGLDWIHMNRIDAKWLATFPCDAPFFPRDLVPRLCAAAHRANAMIGVAESGGVLHPTFAVWSTILPVTSDDALRAGASRKMEDFIAMRPHVRVDFPPGDIDPFFNINTPEDLAQAETMSPPD